MRGPRWNSSQHTTYRYVQSSCQGQAQYIRPCPVPGEGGGAHISQLTRRLRHQLPAFPRRFVFKTFALDAAIRLTTLRELHKCLFCYLNYILPMQWVGGGQTWNQNIVNKVRLGSVGLPACNTGEERESTFSLSGKKRKQCQATSFLRQSAHHHARKKATNCNLTIKDIIVTGIDTKTQLQLDKKQRHSCN